MIIPLLLLAVSASAQDLDTAVAQAKTAVAASRVQAAKAADAARPPSSCADAKELETSFEMTIAFAGGRKVEQKFAYAGCREEGRNDYLPPYTERSYKGQDGYALTIVTEDGRAESEVLLSKGADWVGRFGGIANAKLVSGDVLSTGAVELKDTKGAADLRNAAVPLYPQLKACEAAMTKELGAALRDSAGKPYTGYSRNPALVLLTTMDAYYYHEDCDICAEVTKCSLQSAAVSSVITAHSVSCSDMAPYAKNVVFDACPAGR
jgi:hypothetical protein